MKPFKLGKLAIDAVEFGSQGNAVLGIRDSGKTYTATYFAERLFEAGIPFITFDPVGVWRFLRVPGKGVGYPVVVAGGAEGDLPLTVDGAPEIVRAAMRNGVSLVIDLFDINLSKADWRRIVLACVNVLLHENKAHGLRHVFIEEAAEFIPQKPIDGMVYAAVEKLARMGGNSRLGYTLINQRSQEVAKAVLELCENVFLHRQRGKNALENMDKWLSVAGEAEKKEIIKTLPSLPQGECWAWLGGDNPTPPLLVKVPAKNSLHPDRRVMHGDKGIKPAGAIDVSGFVTSMRTTLVKVDAEAKANDPKALRAQITTLAADKARLERQAQTVAPAAADPQKLLDAERRGFKLGFDEASKQGTISFNTLKEQVRSTVKSFASNFDDNIAMERIEFQLAESGSPTGAHARPAPARAAAPAQRPSPAASGDGSLSGPLQKIVDAIAWWNAFGQATPTNAQVGFVANYKPRGGSWDTYRSRLKSAGLIEYLPGGRLRLTAEGVRTAAAPGTPPTTQQFHDAVRALLDTPLLKLLNPLLDVYPDSLDAEAWGEQAGYQPQGGSWDTYRSRLKGLDLITYPDRGHGRAADWLFP